LQLERAARAEAEAANRVKDEFLMVLSHELRTPLNPILGWARLLKMRQFAPGMVTHALETIERNALHQAHLIEDLLDVSRILQGKLTLNCCPVDLVEVIQGAIASVQLAADAKSIVITTQLDTTVRPVLGNAARLQQVVWNLLSNAVKFTSEGGQVEVRLQEIRSEAAEIENREVVGSGDLTNQPPVFHPHSPEPTVKPFSISHSPSPSPPYAQITVSDTGKGIEASFIPYVFDYFRQSDSTTTRASGGLGLGLAIARHLVELHGGSIAVASDGTGRGAVFTVQLPIPIEARKPEPSPPGNTAPGVRLQGRQILVVGAEDDARELIAVILEQAGAEVIAVDSVAASLEALARSQPDALVSSIDLLRENECELLQRLRLWFQEFGEEIPVVALTPYPEEIDAQTSLTMGLQHILSNAIEPQALVEAIAQAMG
ncbi:MAG TPA: hybrid sensor histidine kinase/response regulator, partial [Allocoleopsis sp.]